MPKVVYLESVGHPPYPGSITSMPFPNGSEESYHVYGFSMLRVIYNVSDHNALMDWVANNNVESMPVLGNDAFVQYKSSSPEYLCGVLFTSAVNTQQQFLANWW